MVPGQLLSPQQACPLPPQATTAPPEHTMPLTAGACPEARHWLLTQQPPPPHELPGQHACPGCPHAVQLPALHWPPF